MEKDITLTPLGVPYLYDASALYLTAFPEAERREVDEWLRLPAAKPLFHPCALTAGGRFAGILTSWHFPARDGRHGEAPAPAFRYIEHFATLPQLRGKGLGSAALAAYREAAAGVPVVVEVELPEDETSRRRVDFYRRNGFALLSRPYTQPPYRPGGESLPLAIMSTDPTFAETHYAHIVSTLRREVYGAE